MTKYTFEVQWPEPFAGDWRRSSQKFASPALAAEAMAEFLLISFQDDVIMHGRIVKVKIED